MTELFEFSPEELVAIRLSLRVAFWAMVGSLPFGVAVALALARGRFWGKSLLNMVVHLPLVMPPVVTGYLLLLLLGRRGPLGRLLDEAFGIVLAFRWPSRWRCPATCRNGKKSSLCHSLWSRSRSSCRV